MLFLWEAEDRNVCVQHTIFIKKLTWSLYSTSTELSDSFKIHSESNFRYFHIVKNIIGIREYTLEYQKGSFPEKR